MDPIRYAALVAIILLGLIGRANAQKLPNSAPSNSVESPAATQQGIAKISGEECEKAMAGIWDPQSIHGGKPHYLKEVYAIANNAVYYFGSIYREGLSGCEKITEADPASFVIFGRNSAHTHSRWAKDKSTVYFGNKILRDADVKSFQVLDYSWGKDKKRVYYMGKPFEGADAGTFRIFANGVFAHDKNHVYQNSAYIDSKTPGLEIIPNIDANTFTVLHAERLSFGNLYVKDKNAVFYNMGDWGKGLVKIERADVTTFHVLGTCFSAHGLSGSYAKDKNHVYCGETILADADTNSFEYVGKLDHENPTSGSLFIAKDKRCVWGRGEKVLDSQGKCVNPSGCTPQSIADAQKNILSTPVCGVTVF